MKQHISKTVEYLIKAQESLLVECDDMAECRGTDVIGDCEGCRVEDLLEQMGALSEAVKSL